MMAAATPQHEDDLSYLCCSNSSNIFDYYALLYITFVNMNAYIYD